MKRKRICGIYKIENLINHKVYIGQSVDIERRFRNHINNEASPHLKRAFEKYGIENFSFEIIKETKDLDYWEIFLIQIYKATDKRYGYNSDFGGNARKVCSEEHKQKISKANSGRKFTKEHKEKLSKAKKGKPSTFKGKKMSEESRRKLSLSHKGQKPHKWTEESKLKLAESKRGENSPNFIGYIICLDNLEVHSRVEWCKLGYNIDTKKHLKRRIKCKGKRFMFKSEYDEGIEWIEEIKEKKPRKKLTDEQKIERRKKMNRSPLIVCLETKEIHTSGDWDRLGYHKAIRVVNGHQTTTKGLHFKFVTDLQGNYVYDEEIAKRVIKEQIDDFFYFEKPKEKAIKEVHSGKKSKSPYIVCLETKEVHTIGGWVDCGYYGVRDVIKDKRENTKGFHFEFVTDLEGNFAYYEDDAIKYIANQTEEFFKIKKVVKSKPLFLCLETNEFKTFAEWFKLGYHHITSVAEGKRKSDKGLHFEFIKDENGNYIYDEETALKIIRDKTLFDI